MNIRQSFVMAVRNLLVNKMRFAQAMLSLIVAIAATIVICNTIQVLVQKVENTWSPENLSNIDIYINTSVDLNKRPTIEDLDRIAAENPDLILAVSPFVTDHTMTGNVRYGEKYYKEAYFVGVNENMLKVATLKLREGRFIQYMDCAREKNVCVLTSRTADKLIGGDALGETLNIYGVNCEVIGVIQDEAEGLIYLPYTCAKKLIGEQIHTGYQNNKFYVNRFEFKANGVENIKSANDLMKEEMVKLLGANENTWYIDSASYLGLKESAKGYFVSRAYNYMLLAMFVLLVGGVGIMNVMLAIVADRTKEIGIRKAFGATNKDIKRQFQLETIIISLIGGLIGTLLGVILSISIPRLVSDIAIGDEGMSYATSDLDIALSAWPILLALAVSVGVGVVFGTYPAKQAAKLEIVEALNEG